MSCNQFYQSDMRKYKLISPGPICVQFMYTCVIYRNKIPRGNGKYQITDKIKIGIKRETLTEKIKISPDEKHK